MPIATKGKNRTRTGRMDPLRAAAWQTIEACRTSGGGLSAAAGFDVYPHTWTRDACIAAFGILSAARSPEDFAFVERTLGNLARGQDHLGRMPLKTDPLTNKPISENSAGVDCGVWFVLAVSALLQASSQKCGMGLVNAALKALHWSEYLDVNGDGLLETPEASDWADMLPHRHNVLYVNVLYAAALKAGGFLCALQKKTIDGERYTQLARTISEKINKVFWVDYLVEHRVSAPALSKLSKQFHREHPEMELAHYNMMTSLGQLDYYLPFIGFRSVSSHIDVLGNLLCILFGIADAGRAAAILDYFDKVGIDRPYPSKAIYPPILPGHPDWRNYFTWRNLNLPHHYHNGGIWPFIGAFHVAALVHVGKHAKAKKMFERVAYSCRAGEDSAGPWVFPEWLHGQTGCGLGEQRALWSASGVLFASRCLQERAVPFFNGQK